MNVLRSFSRPLHAHIESWLQRGPAAQYELLGNGASNSDLLNQRDHRLNSSWGRCCAPQRRRFVTLRTFYLLLVAIPILLVFGILVSGVPPRFADVRMIENRVLPQHNLTQAGLERRKYLKFQKSLKGKGLNNFLQEGILKSYLAYATNRSYVFEDYIWSQLPLPYTLYDFALRPTRMPLNAFISGPTAGGAVYTDTTVHPNATDHSNAVPRAVTDEFYQRACPPEKRRVVSSKDEPAQAEGNVIMEWWMAQLRDVEEECVEISGETTVFDYELFGSDRIHSLWPGLSSSPIIKQFTWSPLVQSALIRNAHILQQHTSSSPLTPSPTLPHTVAVHLRRGDFKRHCVQLELWNVQYMGFNSFPALPDRFTPPGDWEKERSAERKAYYMEHCLPEIEQIVLRLRQVREEHTLNGGGRERLRRVYMLTNGWGWWIAQVAGALKRDGWDEVWSTLDLELDAEQTWVSNAVDMAVAQRAEVFVGNGFSSLSSNIVMLRLGRGMESDTNRFL